MRQFSPPTQFRLSVVIGMGTAICSFLLYMGIVAKYCEGQHTALGFAISMFMLMPASAIASGYLLRLVANRSRGSMKSLLATPSLYLCVALIVRDAACKDFVDGFSCNGVFMLVATWPVTYLAFRVWNRTPAPDPNAPPTCPKCAYNLTGNISGICPECGTPIESMSPSTRGGSERRESREGA